MADAKMLNLAKVQARLARIPAVAADALRDKLPEEVDDALIPAIKAAMGAQYAHQDNDHERLIESVHSYPTPGREISRTVIADARDAEGRLIGAHVEQGHKSPEGGHVAGRPAFWPIWRAYKSGIRRRLGQAARAAVRKAWEK